MHKKETSLSITYVDILFLVHMNLIIQNLCKKIKVEVYHIIQTI